MVHWVLSLLLVASLLLVVRPGAPSSFLFLVAMPGAPSSFLFLVECGTLGTVPSGNILCRRNVSLLAGDCVLSGMILISQNVWQAGMHLQERCVVR